MTEHKTKHPVEWHHVGRIADGRTVSVAVERDDDAHVAAVRVYVGRQLHSSVRMNGKSTSKGAA
jgi:hypothetical protein